MIGKEIMKSSNCQQMKLEDFMLNGYMNTKSKYDILSLLCGWVEIFKKIIIYLKVTEKEIFNPLVHS